MRRHTAPSPPGHPTSICNLSVKRHCLTSKVASFPLGTTIPLSQGMGPLWRRPARNFDLFIRSKCLPMKMMIMSMMMMTMKVKYRSIRSFNMPPYCSNSALTGQKCRSNAPHWGPFRLSNAPTPGTFHRHKNDRRTAETPSVVEQNLYKYNKN